MLQTSFSAALFIIQLVFLQTFLCFHKICNRCTAGTYYSITTCGCFKWSYSFDYWDFFLRKQHFSPMSEAIINMLWAATNFNQSKMSEFELINLRFQSSFLKRARCSFPSFKLFPSWQSGNLFSDRDSRKGIVVRLLSLLSVL